MRPITRPAIRILVLLVLLGGLFAGGCARAQLRESRDNNKMLLQENQRLKQELNDTKAELTRTKIALDRANADLAAAKR
jgi:hypothetical protein